MTNQTVFDFLCVVQFLGYIAIISKPIFLFFRSDCSSSIVLDVPGGHNPWPFFSTMSLFLGSVSCETNVAVATFEIGVKEALGLAAEDVVDVGVAHGVT